VSARFELALRVPLSGFGLELELASDARRLGVFGPSGAGKTTLLESVAGWRRGARGRVVLDGRVLLDSSAGLSLAIERRDLGYVPQDTLLFPHRDVRGNVLSAAGARAAGRELVQRVLSVLELVELLDRPVATLSGGERRRVALARALCSRPRALLLDEPLAGLDHALRRRVLAYLVRVCEEFELPLLLVSHEATEVAALCDEVACLRRGRVVARGRPRDVFAEAWRQEPGEQALENVLFGAVDEADDDTARVALSEGGVLFVPGEGLTRGARVVLAVRADEILVARAPPVGLSARNVLPARVVRLDEVARGVLLRARLEPAGPTLDVLLTRASSASLGLAAGGICTLVLKSNSVRVLSSLPGAG